MEGMSRYEYFHRSVVNCGVSMVAERPITLSLVLDTATSAILSGICQACPLRGLWGHFRQLSECVPAPRAADAICGWYDAKNAWRSVWRMFSNAFGSSLRSLTWFRNTPVYPAGVIFFARHYFLLDISAIYKSIWMILGARESWRALLYNESKNIKHFSAVFSGDDFEKIFSKTKFRKFLVEQVSIDFLWNSIWQKNYASGIYGNHLTDLSELPKGRVIAYWLA